MIEPIFKIEVLSINPLRFADALKGPPAQPTSRGCLGTLLLCQGLKNVAEKVHAAPPAAATLKAHPGLVALDVTSHAQPPVT